MSAAPLTGFTQTVNNLFKVTWGNIDLRLGVLYTLPVDLQEDARSVKLNWIGSGVTFQVSTDSGRTWEDAENGQITQLKNYGRKLLIRAYLFLDSSTVLDSYSIQINPATYMLFTGKVLEDTGFIYFGARWYDPEIGRFVSVDPAEDGENWYGYCGGDPINWVDPDGTLSYYGQDFWMLAGPFYYAWDVVNSMAEMYKLFTPYPFLPREINSVIVGYRIAEAVIVNPKVILDFAMNAGSGIINGLIGDIVNLVKEYPKIAYGKPTDEEVRVYGKYLTGTVLTVIAAVKVGKIVMSGIKGGKTFAQVSREIFKKNPRGRRKTVLSDGSIFAEVEELHHRFIKTRSKWASNWIKNAKWNLKRIWTLEHAKIDPFRFRFIPKEVKELIKDSVKFKLP